MMQMRNPRWPENNFWQHFWSTRVKREKKGDGLAIILLLHGALPSFLPQSLSAPTFQQAVCARAASGKVKES